eukprot:7005722-Alexandrium_andersonii.AAC.1
MSSKPASERSRTTSPSTALKAPPARSAMAFCQGASAAVWCTRTPCASAKAAKVSLTNSGPQSSTSVAGGPAQTVQQRSKARANASEVNASNTVAI